MRGGDSGHPVSGIAGDILAQVRPRFTAVSRELHVAIVGPHPENPLFNRRFVDGGDGAVAHRTNTLELASVALRQIGTHCLPTLASKRRPEQNVGPHV